MLSVVQLWLAQLKLAHLPSVLLLFQVLHVLVNTAGGGGFSSVLACATDVGVAEPSS